MDATWICPTWNRPKLLAELIGQFQRQYRAESAKLLILDDAGQYESQYGDDGQGGHRWKLISFLHPFRTLGDKYNALLAMVDTDVTIIAEDDDLYAPWHTDVSLRALTDADVAKPSRVCVEYGGQQKIESDPGRFHASLAFRTEFVRGIGGWPTNKRADFDLQMIAKLRAASARSSRSRSPLFADHLHPPQFADPLHYHGVESYTFRWETTRHTHAQAYGSGPADEQWLEKARAAAGDIVKFVGPIVPGAKPL